MPVSKTHRWRHARAKAGMSIEDIARQDKVKPEQIETSIRLVEAQAQLFGIQSVETDTIELVSHVKEIEKMAVTEALVAEKRVYAHEGENAGEVIASEPDHEIRLRASEGLTEKIKAVMVRHVKGHTQNTNVNVGVGVGISAGESTNFESRLRDIVKKRQLSTSQTELPAGGNVIEIVPEKEKTVVDGSTA
jgi:hypothetical protein